MTISNWQPGAPPIESSTLAPAPGITWIDLDRAIPDVVDADIEQLGLAEYHPQQLRFLFSRIRPDAPDVAQRMDNFDPSVAETLLSRSGPQVLQAAEPYVLEIEVEGESEKRLTLMMARIGFLAGPGWFITYRERPSDSKFTGDPEPSSRLAPLIESARDYQRSDQTSLDVSTMMLTHLARQTLNASLKLSDEVANRMTDLHRSLAAGESDKQKELKFTARLEDIRWAVDSLERQTRHMTGANDLQVERWYEGSDESQRTQLIYERALDETRKVWRNLGEALVWQTNENNRRILRQQAVIQEQQAETQRQQADAQEQRAGLEHLLSRLSIFFLGPALVAAIFGASPAWLEDHQRWRAVVMFSSMIVVAAIAAFAIRQFRTKRKPAVSTLGTPIYGLPKKLGAEINRPPDRLVGGGTPGV